MTCKARREVNDGRQFYKNMFFVLDVNLSVFMRRAGKRRDGGAGTGSTTQICYCRKIIEILS